MKEKFLIGCCYYPEHWDEVLMEQDLQRIKSLGFNTIRMGEFSWSLYEKTEGNYDFSFLIKAVEIAKSLGLWVILGTPTAAPPKWLTDRYPEVLCKTEDGKTLHHGSRQHHNHTSEIYLKYCALITTAMVKAFCTFENVIGWQIDNELNCHRNTSYSEADDLAFAKWLKNKYKSIDELNKAWGTNFWSLTFNDFSEIECPKNTTTHKNPAYVTDYYMFLSDAVINYASVQAKIIKKYMPNAFVTHNGYFANIDYSKLTKECLDFLSYDSYPAFFEQNKIADGRKAAYRLTQTRGCSTKFLVLEQQSGAGGQLKYLLPTPLPGQIRLWTYQSIAHGAAGILYFRYRTALYGAEQLWYGIYDHNGEENYRSREIREIANELERVGDIFLKAKKGKDVAIFLDYHNICANSAEPFFADDSRSIFENLNAKNVAVDIIGDIKDIHKYKVVIFSHIAVADEKIKREIEIFTENNGIAILSARSGTKDKNANYRPLKSPGIFRDLAGCSVDWFTAVPKHSKQFVRMKGKTYPAEIYYESLEAECGDIVATYTEGFCKGKPAIVKNKNTYYVGFYCGEDTDIYYDIISQNIKLPHCIHNNLEEVVLGDYKLYLNHGDEEISLTTYDILSEKNISSIKPFGVVLQKIN